MVKHLLNFLNKEVLGLHKVAFLLGFFALSSQVLALLRDRLLAHGFGAGVDLDIYYSAFRVPDIIFVAVASLVSVSIIVPFLSEKLKKGKEEVRSFLTQVFSFFFLTIILVSGIVYLLAPSILSLVFPGFSGADLEKLILITRIMLLSPILLGISNLLGGINLTRQRFVLYALSPVMYNTGIILGILILSPKFGVVGVASGVVLGAFLHMVVHIPFILKSGLLPSFSLNLDYSVISSIVKTSFPRTLTLSINQILIIFFISIASLLATGSVTVFSFSFNLQSVVLSIVGVSYSMAVFPTLARLYFEGDRKGFKEHVITSAQHIIFWSVSATVVFIVLRAQIVRVILGTGNFDWEATQLTAASLALFSASVVFQGLSLLFIKSYYAMNKTLLPLLVNLFSGLVSVLSALMIVHLFKNIDIFRFFMEELLRVGGLEGTEVLMLPLSFSFGLMVNGVILWFLLNKKYKNFTKPILRTFSQIFASSLIAGAGAYVALGFYSLYFELRTLFAVLMQGVFAGVVFVLINIFVLIMLENKEIRAVFVTIKQKFWRNSTSIDVGLPH